MNNRTLRMVFLVTAFLYVLFQIASDSINAQMIPQSQEQQEILDIQDARLEPSIERSTKGSFIPSLDAKENVDFLLTPALLVQEAVSPNIVPTYPND